MRQALVPLIDALDGCRVGVAPVVDVVARHGWNIALINRRACVGCPLMPPPLAGLSTPCPRRRSLNQQRRGGQGVDNPTPTLANRPGDVTTRRNIALFKNSVLGFASCPRRRHGPPGEWPPTTERRPFQTRSARLNIAPFKHAGKGGARPGAGRKGVRRSRVPHRSRERISRHRPVHVTLRVLDGLPGLRRAAFVRAFRAPRRMSRPGFRVVHYSVQDNHAHFLVEAAGKERLANGMKSLAARRLLAPREAVVLAAGLHVRTHWRLLFRR